MLKTLCQLHLCTHLSICKDGAIVALKTAAHSQIYKSYNMYMSCYKYYPMSLYFSVYSTHGCMCNLKSSLVNDSLGNTFKDYVLFCTLIKHLTESAWLERLVSLCVCIYCTTNCICFTCIYNMKRQSLLYLLYWHQYKRQFWFHTSLYTIQVGSTLHTLLISGFNQTMKLTVWWKSSYQGSHLQVLKAQTS